MGKKPNGKCQLKLDETQVHQLAENIKKARRDLKETIWRTYKNLMLLGKDNTVKRVDLGLVHSSAATDLVSLIVSRLNSDGDLETKGISPSFLIRNWPPAFKEWSTKSVRDAFFASPQFPRLLPCASKYLPISPAHARPGRERFLRNIRALNPEPGRARLSGHSHAKADRSVRAVVGSLSNKRWSVVLPAHSMFIEP